MWSSDTLTYANILKVVMLLLDWQFGLLVGLLPTTSMLLASSILIHYEVGAVIEACIQNFCAGLILAAVGGELFPLVETSPSKSDACLGISTGFITCLFLIYGVDYLVTCLNSIDERQLTSVSYNSIEGKKKEGYTTLSDEEEVAALVGWESPIHASADALNNPNNRQSVKLKLRSIESAVKVIQSKSLRLLQTGTNFTAAEAVAEEIDEEIHRLQYKIDSAKRLIEGSRMNIAAPRGGYSSLSGILIATDLKV